MIDGVYRSSRNGNTKALFAEQLRFKMEDGFPAVTTKKLAFQTMAIELLWFISGQTDNNELTRLNCNIWTANAEADYWKEKAAFPGDLGRVYGAQWRNWRKPNGESIDQLMDAIELIKHNPESRRIIVSAWNPGELDQMALPPCHTLFQFFVHDEKLSLHLYQRSADMFLGVPFNIASYSLMLHMIAKITDKIPDELILTLGDAHIYEDHFEAVKEQLDRKPKPLPNIWINPEISSLDQLTTTHLLEAGDVFKITRLENYQYHPAIKARMAV